MNYKPLLLSAPPTALLTTVDWRTIVKLQIRLEDEHPETSWIHLRGTKMRTVTGFFNEIAAAFQFPVWFGENWDAFIDIVRDRSWLSGTIVTVYDANLLLIDATGKDRANLADVLNLCNRYGEDTYATIETDLNDEDGFHLLCSVSEEEKGEFLARWKQTTLTLADL
ncbi:MAG: barstar family protein [Pseudanabaena sp.]|jgi:hypothetical protein